MLFVFRSLSFVLCYVLLLSLLLFGDCCGLVFVVECWSWFGVGRRSLFVVWYSLLVVCGALCLFSLLWLVVCGSLWLVVRRWSFVGARCFFPVFVRWSSWFVVVGFCLLCVVCMLFVFCSLLLALCYLLFVGCLSLVVRCWLRVVCCLFRCYCLLFVGWWLFVVVCGLFLACCLLVVV